jgi:hypothetical protein
MPNILLSYILGNEMSLRSSSSGFKTLKRSNFCILLFILLSSTEFKLSEGLIIGVKMLLIGFRGVVF